MPKKGPISEGNTPSPTVKKDCKSAKMETSQSACGITTKDAGKFNSQVHVTNLVKLSETMTNADLPTDAEEKWQFVVNHLQTLQKEVSRLQAENNELKMGLASANGKIAYL